MEELGELARARRDKNLPANNPREHDEEAEVLDMIFTLIAYADSKGFDLEQKWLTDIAIRPDWLEIMVIYNIRGVSYGDWEGGKARGDFAAELAGYHQKIPNNNTCWEIVESADSAPYYFVVKFKVDFDEAVAFTRQPGGPPALGKVEALFAKHAADMKEAGCNRVGYVRSIRNWPCFDAVFNNEAERVPT